MKFDPSKIWPYPVLRPRSLGDDYPQAAFEVEIEVERTHGSTAVSVNTEFYLSDPDLLSLVNQEAARYVLMVKSPKTRFRDLVESCDTELKKVFPAGSLSGRVEFTPYLIATKDVPGFHADAWHSDFSGHAFDIDAGSVLAEDEPREYWVETAEDEPLIGSIFAHKVGPKHPDGLWDYEIADDRVWIVMSRTDSARFLEVRSRANTDADVFYMINGIYLPVLIALLNELDRATDEYREYRWFSSIERRLEDVGCAPLGSEGARRTLDAQKVFDSPFLRMPLFAEVVNT